MALGLGFEGYVGIGTEGTYGTPAASHAFVHINTGGDGITRTEERLESSQVYGVYAEKAICTILNGL